jgi:hypothetical protein
MVVRPLKGDFRRLSMDRLIINPLAHGHLAFQNAQLALSQKALITQSMH